MVYNTPYSRANQYSINLAIELYKTDLEVEEASTFLNDLPSLSRFIVIKDCQGSQDQNHFTRDPTPLTSTWSDNVLTFTPWWVVSRVGPFLIIITIQMIRERISSSTVLLLAYTGKNIRYFYVRRNAILLKCDWPKSPVS